MLVDAANTPAGSTFVQRMEAFADVEWMRTFALEHAVGNWDSFGYRNEQNMFAYKPGAIGGRCSSGTSTSSLEAARVAPLQPTRLCSRSTRRTPP